MLNGRWRMPRAEPDSAHCAGCGRRVPEGARVVFRDGELLHAHCAHHDGGLA